MDTPTPLPEKPKGNWNGVKAYIPVFFIIAALQRLEDETLMFHAKNGAALTLISFVDIVVMALIHELTGYLMLLVTFLVALMGALHAYKYQQWAIPGISSWAQNIPLERWSGKDNNEPPTPTNPNSNPNP